jgi:hypothetical protein
LTSALEKAHASSNNAEDASESVSFVGRINPFALLFVLEAAKPHLAANAFDFDIVSSPFLPVAHSRSFSDLSRFTQSSLQNRATFAVLLQF